MSNFKQALRSTAAFLVLTLLCCTGLIVYNHHRSLFVYQDARVRAELAGSLDLLICDGSYGEVSINPEDLDAALGCTSYNLGSPRLLLHGRTWLLRKELARNPVKTVILEISLDVLGVDETRTVYARGEARTLTRLDTVSEQWQYFRQYVPPKSWEDLAAVSLRYAAASLLGRIAGVDRTIVPAVRGYRTNPQADQTLSPEEVAKSKDSKPIDEPRQANMEELQTMMDLCREYDVQVLVVVTPTSDAYHWVTSGEQACYDTLRDFCRRNGAMLLNFDLDRDRYSLYRDDTSFSDRCHLCQAGAQVFSPRFAGIVRDALAGADVSDLFFSDYEEMEARSPYAAAP